MHPTPPLINVGSRQLVAFLELCRLQSFSKAAEQIPISPSGMSMLVKELEQQVGARLFDRTTRSVTLTEAGRRLQPVAERIVAELRAVAAAIDGTQASVRARLEVAATPMVSASLLPDVVKQFATSHPHVRVRLSDVDVMTVRGRVLAGEADLGLGFFFKPAVGLVRTPLCQFRLMRVSPRADGAGRGLGPPQAWSSLAGLPLISLPADNPIQSLIETHLAAIGRAHEERPAVNLIGTLIAMVEAGLGHAIVPSFALGQCLRHDVSIALLARPAVHIDLYLVTRRGSQRTPAEVAFTESLKAAAARLTGVPG
jgi:DNA-binding transcriptional LysR family regulator